MRFKVIEENNIYCYCGDLLKDSYSNEIICHQVNIRGVMGGGIALQIKREFPKVFRYYANRCNCENPIDLLGTHDLVYLDNGRIVSNLYAQDLHTAWQTNYKGLKKPQRTQLTQPDKLRRALNELAMEVEAMNADEGKLKYEISLPYKIGCGLGGGDWEEIFEIIKSVANSHPMIKFNIYKLL